MKKKCKNCGKEFEAKDQAEYCSKECWIEYHKRELNG